ncbi:TIR domain-containing protein [Caldimonas sp. KR1-144]|uniref:TIR domain-containing protein n=1 Tax=Caldimonas sp. KR1-144 TaxID=3400911 RepID=UPI003C04FB34
MSADALRSPSSGGATEAPPARRYGAFLSYSHRDAALATWLQRGLETYRLPPRLAGRETAVGPVPRTVGPVFRDRDELPAGADLATHVREGLAASRWLIVVCSPAAAASPWVEREILEFKRLHGEERVLAVIAAGEPYASRRPGREQEECFPQALRHARAADGTPTGAELEPIAVDLRKQGDGKRMALLKLIAGMTGVGVDELAQRDAQRRARRLAWLAVGATVGMLVMGVMAVMALQARNEAREQRAQAEDLIEFMLGDLRKKLEPVGRLEVLDAVGEKALGYYGRQDAAKLDATSLGHRSRAMHLIGEIRGLRGQRDLAEKAFRSAAETTAQMLARAPNDPQRIFDHAQSEYWVGLVAWQSGDLPVAAQRFGEYLRLARRLVVIDSAKPDWQIELAMASTNLGAVYIRQGRVHEALALFDETLRLYEPLTAQRPELRVEQAKTLGWKSDAYETLGDYGRAAEAQRAKVSLFDAMPDATRNRIALMGRVNVAYTLARLELQMGHFDRARAEALDAVEKANTLTSVDSTNKFWLQESTRAQLALADALAALNRCTEALEPIEAASKALPALRSGNASNLDVNVLLPSQWLDLAIRCKARPDAQLLAQAREYLTQARRLIAEPGHLTPARARSIALVEFLVGRKLATSGNAEAAQAHWRSALSMLDASALAIEADSVAALKAQILLHLDRASEARPIVQRLQTRSLRSPIVLELFGSPTPGESVSQPRPKE